MKCCDPSSDIKACANWGAAFKFASYQNLSVMPYEYWKIRRKKQEKRKEKNGWEIFPFNHN